MQTYDVCSFECACVCAGVWDVIRVCKWFGTVVLCICFLFIVPGINPCIKKMMNINCGTVARKLRVRHAQRCMRRRCAGVWAWRSDGIQMSTHGICIHTPENEARLVRMKPETFENTQLKSPNKRQKTAYKLLAPYAFRCVVENVRAGMYVCFVV